MRPPTPHPMTTFSHPDTGIPHSGTSSKFFGVSGRASMSPRSSLSGGIFPAPSSRHPRPSLGAVAEAAEERDLEQGETALEVGSIRIEESYTPCLPPGAMAGAVEEPVVVEAGWLHSLHWQLCAVASAPPPETLLVPLAPEPCLHP